MPSIYTHNYFAKDVEKKLVKTNNFKIKDNRYMLIFAQSFDNLFYYNVLSLKKGAKIRNLGHYAHTHNILDYFVNLISYIKENKLYNDPNLGYLYGSVCHYALDSTAHPYVHYFSGRFSKKKKKKTKKYMGNHAINEIMLDSIYYYKENKGLYCNYKLYKDIIPKTTFPKTLINTIDYAFSKTFGFNNMGKIYNVSYNQSRNIYKLLMYDKFGIKKFLYKLCDLITPFKNFKAYSYSHHIKKPKYDIMNYEKNEWKHPVTGKTSNKSFEELYNVALKKAVKIITEINLYFNDETNLNKLKKVIKNNSYSSGLDANKKVKFKYFKF